MMDEYMVQILTIPDNDSLGFVTSSFMTVEKSLMKAKVFTVDKHFTLEALRAKLEHQLELVLDPHRDDPWYSIANTIASKYYYYEDLDKLYIKLVPVGSKAKEIAKAQTEEMSAKVAEYYDKHYTS